MANFAFGALRSLKYDDLSILLNGALAATSVAVGSKQIGLGTVWDALWSYDSSQNDHLIIHTLRIPRAVIGLAVGVALGLAGGVMQGVTRNPLAAPGILGIPAGSSLAVVVAIYVFAVSTLSSYVRSEAHTSEP